MLSSAALPSCFVRVHDVEIHHGFVLFCTEGAVTGEPTMDVSWGCEDVQLCILIQNLNLLLLASLVFGSLRVTRKDRGWLNC
jgi:hypothetical protein